jgi:hypothetical protein
VKASLKTQFLRIQREKVPFILIRSKNKRNIGIGKKAKKLILKR